MGAVDLDEVEAGALGALAPPSTNFSIVACASRPRSSACGTLPAIVKGDRGRADRRPGILVGVSGPPPSQGRSVRGFAAGMRELDAEARAWRRDPARGGERALRGGFVVDRNRGRGSRALMRPRRSTRVASIVTMPAPDMARLIQC